jgi:quercetin dioxygenase-like cupin family protein
MTWLRMRQTLTRACGNHRLTSGCKACWSTVKVSSSDGDDGICVLEFRAPAGAATPLHVHHTHDEVFHILEGEVTWRVGEDDIACRPGDTLLAPKQIPHGYRVVSPQGARWLSVTHGADFEGCVRALSRSAQPWDVPQPTAPPSGEGMQTVVAAARRNGMEVLGPPPIAGTRADPRRGE